MATARKLPSGSYRVKVFKGYKYINGQKKREYESFTAPTKAEAEALASAWKLDRKQRPEDVSVHDAIRKYIDVSTTKCTTNFEHKKRGQPKPPIL